jgi:cyclase
MKLLNGQQVKHRIIPIILTNGSTVVKGTNFNNWRTVGSVQATANLFASRDVDELILLDVGARNNDTHISTSIVEKFSDVLMVPFGVGGGIDNLTTATSLLSAGAEKVILGTSAFNNMDLVSQIANKFGNQAISVTIDLDGMENLKMKINSGKIITDVNPLEYAQEIVKKGAGEIILQSIVRDGCRAGMDIAMIELFAANLDVPVVASSGAGQLPDFLLAIKAGASAVAAGAIFQFTEITPLDVKKYLKGNLVSVREI